ncbi:MAG: ATP-binding cassette domain-containing protein [Chloroflexi bacterium]|nr:ATP-binding cassette domain-containing protein [Chloroflexota bacterium]
MNSTVTDATRAVSSQPAKLLEVKGLKKYFPVRTGVFQRTVAQVKAVDDVSFDVWQGEILGVVGESGCGKSTTARLLIRLIDPDAGVISFQGKDAARATGGELKALRRDMQIVFQDPYASLNPRMNVQDSIAFSLLAHQFPKKAAVEKAWDVLEKVGMNPAQFGLRYPHELSGGQRQRVNIARALALDPELLLLDEPVSSLDKSIQAQVLNLLGDLRQSLGLSYIFISHDLHVVEYLSDRVAVMYLGKIVELGNAADLYDRPLHPYTQALLASVPNIDPAKKRAAPPLMGDPPSPINPPSGCRFRTRCPFAKDICAEVEPPLLPAEDRLVACHLYSSASRMNGAAKHAAATETTATPPSEHI